MRSWPVTYADPGEFEDGFSAIRAEFEIPEQFPDAVRAAARSATPPQAPRDDLTSVPFVAIDPAGSRDLDQIFYAEKGRSGYQISYAIADVAAYVVPGDPVDIEANQRGVTVYSPDLRSPLHPRVLSEGAASLLAGEERPAVVWTLNLDLDGYLVDTNVRRGLVRNRAALSYQTAQETLDNGSADPSLKLLEEVGRHRQRIEAERGGVSLNLPTQYVTKRNGTYHVEYETTRPVESWNAHISLLTGMAAAQLMVDSGVGLLRTLPPPSERTLSTLRRKSRALGVPFDDDTTYAEWVRSLDSSSPTCLALLNQATSGLRGAGYVWFNGELPQHPEHAAIAAAYTHVTAPLRRLVDRYTSELALSICADTETPEWVLTGLESMPSVMSVTVRKERRFNRAIVDFTEALALQHRRGETFEAVVVDVESDHVTLQLVDPAVVTQSNRTDLHLGAAVTARLEACDPATRTVTFSVL